VIFAAMERCVSARYRTSGLYSFSVLVRSTVVLKQWMERNMGMFFGEKPVFSCVFAGCPV